MEVADLLADRQKKRRPGLGPEVTSSHEPRFSGDAVLGPDLVAFAIWV
jgi:hypothetical protein